MYDGYHFKKFDLLDGLPDNSVFEKFQKIIKEVVEFRKKNPEKIYWKFPDTRY